LGEYAFQVLEELQFSGAGFLVARAILWGMLAYHAHAETLFPEKGDENRTLKAGNSYLAFGFMSAAILLVVIAATVVATFSLPLPEGEARYLFALGFTLLFLPIALCLFGLTLPAYVADYQSGISIAVKRGLRQFVWMFSRLIAGPGVVFVISVVIFVVAIESYGDEAPFLFSNYFPNPFTSIPALIAYGIQAYATIMVAVILSRAYLKDLHEQDIPYPPERKTLSSNEQSEADQ